MLVFREVYEANKGGCVSQTVSQYGLFAYMF